MLLILKKYVNYYIEHYILHKMYFETLLSVGPKKPIKIIS